DCSSDVCSSDLMVISPSSVSTPVSSMKALRVPEPSSRVTTVMLPEAPVLSSEAALLSSVVEAAELLSSAAELDSLLEAVELQAARLRARAAAQIEASTRFISIFFSLFAVMYGLFDTGAAGPPVFPRNDSILAPRRHFIDHIAVQSS